MPELPEVETVRRTLLPVRGARITSVWTSGKALRLGARVPKQNLTALVGQFINDLHRHGKVLWLAAGDAAVIVHLGMSGQLRLHAPTDALLPHTHVRLGLTDNRELRFVDPRRFGLVDVTSLAHVREHRAICTMGPDPICDNWSPDALAAALHGRKTPIKVALLDQTLIAGIGNIYASEALWRARIAPTRAAGSLTSREHVCLHQGVVTVLQDSIVHGGTTLRDYRAADGSPGYHVVHLGVYDCAGEPCKRCRTRIATSVMAGRATYWCPRCQKK